MLFPRVRYWAALVLGVVFAIGQAIADPPLSPAVQSVAEYLAKPLAERGPLAKETFAEVPLSAAEADAATGLLWNDHVARLRADRAAEMKERVITLGELKMPFFYKTFGDKPKGGRSLFISLHGGGGAPPRVNDQQWENQKRLYEPAEGVYLVPRAATNTWDLWHQSHIDPFFERLIENLVVFEDVDPNRVYVMGYSAGGDGVFQLAPRMADRFAAAAMMAGHPNETSPLGLRNLPFTIHMGERDAAYDRNKIAGQWKEKLAELRLADPQGYPHLVKLHEGKGHWMDRQDAEAVPWMAKHERTRYPERIVWKQDDVRRSRFYWLAVDSASLPDRAEVVVARSGQSFAIEKSDPPALTIRLHDAMIDFEKPIRITSGERVVFEGKVKRTIATLAKTLAEYGDRSYVFSAEVTVTLDK